MRQHKIRSQSNGCSNHCALTHSNNNKGSEKVNAETVKLEWIAAARTAKQPHTRTLALTHKYREGERGSQTWLL